MSSQDTPHELQHTLSLMHGYPHPWGLGGGWAIDAFLGQVTRPHADVDLVIWRPDQRAFRQHFVDWEWQTFLDQTPVPWPADQELALPYHNAKGMKGRHELEVLLLEREGETWWYRRNPAIRMSAERVILPTSLGLPVFNPALALLFKSTRVADKDHHDFHQVLPHLASQDRDWLYHALKLTDINHIWLKALKI